MMHSLIDNDQYKFTMQQALLKLGFAAVPVEYKFHCRTKGIDFWPYYEDIKNGIAKMSEISLTKQEHYYMRCLRYFHDDYLQLLRGFKFDLDYVSIHMEGNQLSLRIKGPWFNTILFEVPCLYIISEAVCNNGHIDFDSAEKKLDKKLGLIEDWIKFLFAEFGTRRRKSYEWQYKVLKKCDSELNFIGTSNLHFAHKLGLTAIGTMAHEWLQAHQQLNYRVADSQKMAFENWIKVYRGDLGIALSDVINTDAFLKDFDDPLFYKLFDGVREDSEPDPITFGKRMRDFYMSRGIDPMTKTIVFSNGLNFEKAMDIYQELRNQIGVSFGIGTNLTNDFDEKPPLNIVMKMVKCNGHPVAKISNSPGKGMCESPEYVEYLKSVYDVK